jgi:superfamily I DNA and/or RNA helicase
VTAIQAAQNDADRVLEAAIAHAIFGTDPIVIVESPPGAGKTYLVECAAAVAVANPAMRVLVVTPGVSQAYDVVDRLLEYNLPRLELAHAKHRTLPNLLQGRITASLGWSTVSNRGPGVVVANAHLLHSYLDVLPSGSFDLMIVDEAYQLAAGDYLPIAALANRVLMVGDPGQLDPVNSADTTNLEAAPHKVHRSAPGYILDRFPNTPVYGLPVTRRLLPDSASLVQASFYPRLQFHSVVDPASRRLRLPIPGVLPGIDTALDAIAAGASIVAVTLSGNAPSHDEVDPELSDLMAAIADRFLVRQAEWVGQRTLGETDIGCIDPHVIAGGAISDGLRSRGRGSIRVETVERWQGLQVPISVVRHPLSRVGKPMPFDLEAGRWCVSLSRHQIGCIIVARETVSGVISDYVHGCDTVAAGAKDAIWAGYEAHRRIWSALDAQGRIFAV